MILHELCYKVNRRVERAHRAYGRLVLEEGVKELYKRAGKEPPK